MIVSDGKAIQAALERWHKPWHEQLRLMGEEQAVRDGLADLFADHSIDCECILCVDGEE